MVKRLTVAVVASITVVVLLLLVRNAPATVEAEPRAPHVIYGQVRDSSGTPVAAGYTVHARINNVHYAQVVDTLNASFTQNTVTHALSGSNDNNYGVETNFQVCTDDLGTTSVVEGAGFHRTLGEEGQVTAMDNSVNTDDRIIDINEIMEMIPHRYPFLLIDKVKDIQSGESAIGIKNVTVDEPYFEGHFPGHPIMPGVLIIEAMAQTSAVLVVEAMGKKENRLVYFMTVDQARFRKPVLPGDRLELTVRKERSRGNVWKFKGEAHVDGNLKAEAVFSAMIIDK